MSTSRAGVGRKTGIKTGAKLDYNSWPESEVYYRRTTITAL